MSLINEMLRDLEKRRANELGKADLQREIRVLPELRQQGRRWPWLLGFGLLLGGVAGAAWWQLEDGRYRADVTPAVPQPPVTVLPPPAPELIPGTASDALRLAITLESIPEDSAAPASVLPDKRSETGKSGDYPNMQANVKPEAAAPKVEPLVSKPKASEAVQLQGNIEKTELVGTARERADTEYRRAQALLAAGQAAQAQESLLTALRLDATYAPARQVLLRLLLDSRRIDDAVAVLQEGLDQQPAQLAWAMSLARLQVDKGDIASAERVLARSAPYATASAEYAGFHGYLLNRAGQPHQAAERYQLATRLSPAEGRWWFGLGQALEGDGHQQEAREAFRRALAAGNLNADLTALAEQKLR